MDYFESYEDLEVHKCMLEDTVRNNAYRKAIFDNRNIFKGKTVLDVGAGTGILSIFCAQAGASRVYAVEASNVYKLTEEIVAENGVDDVVKIIHGSIENITLPENEKVDIIVSEWMGHFLLHEGMLDSVINARDRFLKPNGLLFPENATIYSAPCGIPSLNENWSNVCGVSMTTFGEKLKCQTCQAPKIMTISGHSVLSDPEIVAWLDLREITVEDVNKFKVSHLAVADKSGRYQGVCIWFSCSFPSNLTEPVILSTDPSEPETHWKQTLIVLPINEEIVAGNPIAYDITIARSAENNRRYQLEIEMLDPEIVQHPAPCNCYYTKCILTKAVLEKYEQNAFSIEIIE